MNVVILDTGIANFGSIESAVVRAGGKPHIGRTPRDIEDASHIILPGVGSFDVAMRTIDERKLRDVLHRKATVEKTPTLGICLGMQLLGASSEEGKIAGLGWLKGRTLKIASRDLKVPHIGWNKVQWDRQMPLFEGIEPGARFYFVHSYHYKTEKPDEIVADVEYGDRLAAVIQHDNIVGAQFHPEKSRAGGLQLLRNFLRMTH
ncbi:MAG: imidazole glycerol phosphate synthase subunit HisH [Pseudomonadota bacterium]